MNLIVTSDQVRAYLELNTPGSTSRYSDETINSNIRAAQSTLEFNTTLLQAQVALPGFRSFSRVTWGTTIMTVGLPDNSVDNPSCWGLWEASPGIPDDSRLIIGLQFRPWRVDNDRPWWYADSQWFDKLLDSPFYPGNWGGGYAFTSMPNDLVITGDGGYAPGSEPEAVKQAVKVLASFYTMRPASILATVAITPQGSVLNYSDLPAEVSQFIADWKIGMQAQSVG